MDKLERAKELGVMKQGWRFLDYCLDAVPRYAWLCMIIWGEKGSGKSSTMLQHGYTVFHGFDEIITKDGLKQGVVTKWDDMKAWETTLRYTIFRPKDFAGMLKLILQRNTRLAWVGWDDINIHFPRSMYSTNRTVWENFSKNWEGFRANLSIFECTAPRKDKVVSFILSDMNWDMLVSSRSKSEVHRWFWDEDYYEPEKVNKYRLDVDSELFEIGHIPKEVWDEYWNRKMALIEESTKTFETMLNDIDRPIEKASVNPQQFICSNCGRELGNAWNLRMHIPKCKVATEKSQARASRVVPVPQA